MSWSATRLIPGGTLGNPDDPPLVEEFSERHYGFGNTEGTVLIGGYGIPANRVTWSDQSITVNLNQGTINQVPAGADQLR